MGYEPRCGVQYTLKRYKRESWKYNEHGVAEVNAWQDGCRNEVLSRIHRNWRWWQTWHKQYDNLPPCWRINSSLSTMTPRSRMESVGSMTTVRTLKLMSSRVRLASIDFEQSQISFDSSRFNWNLREEHQSSRRSMQSRRRYCGTVKTHVSEQLEVVFVN